MNKINCFNSGTRVPVVFLILIISLCLVTSNVFSEIYVPPVGPGSCVTYEHARAVNPSLKDKTDAQLKALGFCSGSSNEDTTNTETTTTQDETNYQYEPLDNPTNDPVIAAINFGGEKEFYLWNKYSDLMDKFYDYYDYDNPELTAIQNEYNTFWDFMDNNDSAEIKRQAAINQLLDNHSNCLDNCTDSLNCSQYLDYDDYYANYDACENRVTECFNDCGDTLDIESGKVWTEYYNEITLKMQQDLDSLQQKYDSLSSKDDDTEAKDETKDTDTEKTKENIDRTTKIDGSGQLVSNVEDYEGTAHILRPGQQPILLTSPAQLQKGDIVTTSDNSRLVINFNNGGTINLSPNTGVKIDDILLNQYIVTNGSVKADIKWVMQPRVFGIRTPYAATTVTGTNFILDFNTDTNISTVYLYEGKLDVNTLTDQKLSITSGQTLTIYPDGRLKLGTIDSNTWAQMSNNYVVIPKVNGDAFLKGMAWVTFIIIILATIASIVILQIAKKKKQKKDKTKSNLGVLSLVLGIFGILFFWFPLLGYPLSAIGMTLGRLQKLREPTGLAKAGIVLGIIGVILATIIFFAAYLGPMIK